MAENMLRTVQLLNAGAIYYFFELDLTNWGIADPLRFHTNGVVETLDEVNNRFIPNPDMTYKGQVYTYAHIDISGLQISNDGKVNTPTLTVMNEIRGQRGAVSALCMLYNNLVGARLNFYMTSESAYNSGVVQEERQVWYVDRKSDDNHINVAFELTSPLDFKRQQIPTRLVSDVCYWAMRGEYRGESCGYTGTKYFDQRGEPVNSITLDECGGTCEDCIKRFGQDVELPFGGFLIPYKTDY